MCLEILQENLLSILCSSLLSVTCNNLHTDPQGCLGCLFLPVCLAVYLPHNPLCRVLTLAASHCSPLPCAQLLQIYASPWIQVVPSCREEEFVSVLQNVFMKNHYVPSQKTLITLKTCGFHPQLSVHIQTSRVWIIESPV